MQSGLGGSRPVSLPAVTVDLLICAGLVNTGCHVSRLRVPSQPGRQATTAEWRARAGFEPAGQNQPS